MVVQTSKVLRLGNRLVQVKELDTRSREGGENGVYERLISEEEEDCMQKRWQGFGNSTLNMASKPDGRPLAICHMASTKTSGPFLACHLDSTFRDLTALLLLHGSRRKEIKSLAEGEQTTDMCENGRLTFWARNQRSASSNPRSLLRSGYIITSVLMILDWSGYAFTVLSDQSKRLILMYNAGLYDPLEEEDKSEFCDFMQEMISMMNNVKDEVGWFRVVSIQLCSMGSSQVGLSRVALGRVGSVQFDAVQFGWVWLRSGGMGWVQVGSSRVLVGLNGFRLGFYHVKLVSCDKVWLCSVRYGWVDLGLIRFSWVRFACAQFGSMWFSWFGLGGFKTGRFGSVGFGPCAVQFGLVQFGLVARICGLPNYFGVLLPAPPQVGPVPVRKMEGATPIILVGNWKWRFHCQTSRPRLFNFSRKHNSGFSQPRFSLPPLLALTPQPFPPPSTR
ncbi:hypothetical protein V8G54_020822 [Vigna mungo]|uniref:Uncharacterized protein n=1 Tax=Vigna mungo TaxID=3915 RepID=A0AAQ3NEC4_VIGMU